MAMKDDGGMKAGMAMAGLMALCCGVHLMVLPLLATGALAGLVGGLAGPATLVVTGVVLVVAAGVALTVRRRGRGDTDACEMPAATRVDEADGRDRTLGHGRAAPSSWRS